MGRSVCTVNGMVHLKLPGRLFGVSLGAEWPGDRFRTIASGTQNGFVGRENCFVRALARVRIACWGAARLSYGRLRLLRQCCARSKADGESNTP
jgi:hypothetical protein